MLVLTWPFAASHQGYMPCMRRSTHAHNDGRSSERSRIGSGGLLCGCKHGRLVPPARCVVPKPPCMCAMHTGWYDYDPEGSEVVEQLYHDWSADAGLHERVVASGAWEYHVDLAAMTQTNAIHAAHKMRHIRRWTPQLGADQTPPGEAAKEEEGEEDKKAGACCALCCARWAPLSVCSALLS